MTTTHSHLQARHRGAIAIVACACALTLAACGGLVKHRAISGHPPTFVHLAGCMRAHGVPNFPDPPAHGRIQITVGRGARPASPAFRAALRRCSHPVAG